MPSDSVIRAFLQHSDAAGAKSTVLKPLGWLIGILISGSLGSYYSNAPGWVGATLVVFTGISALIYLVAYIYFMGRNPDLLRSESFTLRKLEIEKGIIGDSLTGIINTESSKSPLQFQEMNSLPSGKDQK